MVTGCGACATVPLCDRATVFLCHCPTVLLCHRLLSHRPTVPLSHCLIAPLGPGPHDSCLMDRTRHLLTVWNPSYADDAMDAHLRVLLSQLATATSSRKVGLDRQIPQLHTKCILAPRPIRRKASGGVIFLSCLGACVAL